MERVGADGGLGASEMNQGTLSFPASQEIPSNWTHRQDTASKGKKERDKRQTNSFTQRNLIPNYAAAIGLKGFC